ncbi:hypothetical protein PFISCL1PPCAC_22594, partial [Pristionchus fissidentatus]
FPDSPTVSPGLPYPLTYRTTMEWEAQAYQMFAAARFPHGAFGASASDAHHAHLNDVLMPSGYSTPVMQSPAYPAAAFDPSMMSASEIKREDDSENKKRGKALLRRYKTPSPQVLRHRRCAANERERKRMTTLNVAYDRLRTVLPEYDTGRRLSKFDTLRMAQEYIAHLNKILVKQPANQSK